MSADREGATAIVGMGCRLPGAADLTHFWTTVQSRRVPVGAVPRERWNHDSYYDPDPRRPDRTYARVLASVDEVDRFCPEFYGIVPRRARVMDPQQRLMLEVARAAIEDAGYASGGLPRATGVYVGISVSEHYQLAAARLNAMQLRDGRFGRVAPGLESAWESLVENVPRTHAHSMIGQMLNMAATSVAQAFDLGGPAFAIDAACSSALVALGEAILHLRAGACDAALVGGVYVACTPSNLIGFSRIGALSPSDTCRPFDERADGFVVGEGAACVLLKRLDDALRDGDRIWAVVRGFGINNDGRSEGPMTPRLEGQVACIERAYADARMSPAQIGLVEAHGTGTRVGDLVEASSLAQVFRAARRGMARPTCSVTAVKGNIGHTLAAAGAAGLLSAALSLAHRRIPPLAGFAQPRRELPLGDAGLEVATAAREWAAGETPRAAALSSFGFGGTNVHVVLEEAPEPAAPRCRAPAAPIAEDTELFVLSAPTLALLAGHAREVAAWMAEGGAPLADVAWTLTHRRLDAARAALVASSRAELVDGLERVATAAEGGASDGVFLHRGEDALRTEEIALLFPGQGAQAPDLSRDLWQRWPTFRERLEELAAAAEPVVGRSLLAALYPASSRAARAAAAEELRRTEVCQPALAALELALVHLLRELGVTGGIVLGHSLGEFVAVAAGGALAPEEAVRLVAERGRLMAELLGDAGAMAALATDGDGAARLADGAHGFHSPIAAPMAARFRALLERATVRAADGAVVVSCAAAPMPGRYDGDGATVRERLARHATSAIDFEAGVREAWRLGARAFLQVGAGSALLSMANAILSADGCLVRLAVPIAPAESTRGEGLLRALAALVGAGLPVRPAPLFRGRDCRLAVLPTSRLEGRRYWVLRPPSGPALREDTGRVRADAPSTGGNLHVRGREDGRAADRVPAPDRGAIERRLVGIVAQVGALPAASINARIRLSQDLGFDSLMMVELGLAIQEAFSAGELPPGLVGRDPTLSDLVDAVTAHLARARVEAAAPRLGRHAARWLARPLASGPSGEPAFAGHAILLGDSGGAALALAARLRSAGRAATVLAAERLKGLIWPADAGLFADFAGLDGVTSEPSTAELRAPVARAAAALAAAARSGVRPAYLAIAAEPRVGGPFGFAKALALERPDRLAKALEVRPGAGPARIAEWAWTELCTSDRSPEVSWTSGERRVVQLEPAPLPEAGRLGAATAIITGGGHGLGARLAVALARAGVRSLALLGRRAADAEAERVLADVAAAGGRALYVRCDVCDEAALAAAVVEARRALGPIQLAIHAAGVTADGPVEEIAEADAARVFDTKAGGALALWRACRGEPLASFLVYGSWAGRFGSRHQTVYAAANRAVSALVPRLGAERPAVRVVSVDLPPWEGSGMVERLPEAVRRALRLRGVPFVRDEDGLNHLLAELAAPGGAVEAVLGSGPPGSGRRDRLRVALDPRAPWLADHRVDGAPRLPLAAALDLAVAAAGRVGLSPGAGRALVLRDVRLLAPIVVGELGATLAVETRAPAGNGDLEPRADIELWLEPDDSFRGEPRLVGYGRATTEADTQPGLGVPAGGAPPHLALDDFYARHTFHGPRLRGIAHVTEIGPGHVSGVVRAAEPGWPRAGLDILALDGALQLASFFARERLGQAALPTGAAECRLLVPLQAGAELDCLAVLEQAEPGALRGHVDMRDRDGRLLVQLRGLEARVVPEGARHAAHEHTDGDGQRPPASIAPATYRIEEFPEVIELAQRRMMAAALGLENPYFRVHERLTNHRSVIGGAEYINFSSYNYLGLSGHPEVNRAVEQAIARYGTSVSASRVASGERPLHHDLERAIADFLGCEDALVMVSGHATNVSVIGCLFDQRDVILHDSLAHDSILAGAKLSGARRRPFPHNDPDTLERLLAQTRPEARRVLIAIEAVYSMDGDLPPLDRIIELKQRYGALLLVDEAHSLGVVGRTGRGIGEHYHVDRGDVDLWMGTLSKSLASCGGYIAGTRVLVEFLKYSNPGFVYSVGISPANGAAALAALHILEREPQRVATLQAGASSFVEALRERGIDTGRSRGSAVVPCIVANSVACLRLAQALFARGINVQPILYPAVEENLARLRFFITSGHSEADLMTTAEALREELLAIGPGFVKTAEPSVDTARR